MTELQTVNVGSQNKKKKLEPAAKRSRVSSQLGTFFGKEKKCGAAGQGRRCQEAFGLRGPNGGDEVVGEWGELVWLGLAETSS